MEIPKKVHSAVIVLHELARDSLVLTKRSSFLRAHPGEICFPGGLWEPEDEDFYHTALRELHEELGIQANRITLVKELATEQTLLGSIIHPWLANIEAINPYVQNSAEVASLIFIPMSLVVDPKQYKELIIKRDGKEYKSCQFIPNKELVWGATARIMRQLTR